MEVLLGIAMLLVGVVAIVLVAWFAVMLVHVLVNVIPDRLNDLSLRRLARRQRQRRD